MKDDPDDPEFWGRMTLREEIELRERQKRELAAAGWRRNMLGIVVLAVLVCVLWYFLRRQ